MWGIEVGINGGRCERQSEIRSNKTKDWLEEGLGDLDQEDEVSALIFHMAQELQTEENLDVPT